MLIEAIVAFWFFLFPFFTAITIYSKHREITFPPTIVPETIIDSQFS
jgi:hypothetical protein